MEDVGTGRDLLIVIAGSLCRGKIIGKESVEPGEGRDEI